MEDRIVSHLTEKERRQVFQDDLLPKGSTFADHVERTEPRAAGRFAKQSSEPTILKSGDQYPYQPPNSPWNCSPVPDEPLIDATDCGPTFDGRSFGNSDPCLVGSDDGPASGEPLGALATP